MKGDLEPVADCAGGCGRRLAGGMLCDDCLAGENYAVSERTPWPRTRVDEVFRALWIVTTGDVVDDEDHPLVVLERREHFGRTARRGRLVEESQEEGGYRALLVEPVDADLTVRVIPA